MFEYTRQNLRNFYDPIEMPGGYSFDHVKTLQMIHLYYNGKFLKGDRDELGNRKYFFNITKPACDVATKFIDLDTKDIVLLTDDPNDQWKLWIMQKDLKQWLKEEKFGVLLNEIGFAYPVFGGVVLRKASDGKWHNVPLANLRMETTNGKTLEDGTFCYELYRMSRQEIKNMGWDKDAVKQLLSQCKDSIITIYECYELNEDDGKKWKRTFKADFLRYNKNGQVHKSEESEINSEENYLDGIILFEDEADKLPYRELAWEKREGRWMPFGFGEYTFDNQIRQNELTNIKARGLQISSLKLFQTRDETVGRNVFTDMVNGDIIKSSSEITELNTNEKNLAAFASEEQRWDANAERKTFTYDVARGESLPGSVTLGATQILSGMVASYFDMKREQFGLFIKALLLDDILPSFKKARKKSHMVKFTSSDKEMEKLRKAMMNAHIRKETMDQLMRGIVPTKESMIMQETTAMQQMQGMKDVGIETLDNFYDDVEASVDIVITGEQMDTGAKMQTLQSALQIVGGNPTILQQPSTRSVFFKILELAGISPVELDMMDDTMNQPMGMQQNVPQQQAPMARAPAMQGATNMPSSQGL